MTNVSRTEQSESMISIYDGRQCVGFVLARGRGGFDFRCRQAFARDIRDEGCGHPQGNREELIFYECLFGCSPAGGCP
jgi:hypothetical protein